jgi:hypothetical protein
MAREEFLDDVHIRILRVTEDLRVIQRELNCAAMEAPGDPELMELLNELPELESLEVLKSAMDQMRHFLWFYVQVMTDGSDGGQQLRESLRQNGSNISEDGASSPRISAAQKFKQVSDAALLRYLSDGKARKPN